MYMQLVTKHRKMQYTGCSNDRLPVWCSFYSFEMQSVNLPQNRTPDISNLKYKCKPTTFCIPIVPLWYWKQPVCWEIKSLVQLFWVTLILYLLLTESPRVVSVEVLLLLVGWVYNLSSTCSWFLEGAPLCHGISCNLWYNLASLSCDFWNTSIERKTTWNIYDS